jgi:cephalosporin hydroxylase
MNYLNLLTNSDLGSNGNILYNKIKKFTNTNFVDLGVRYGVSSSILLEDSIINNNTVYGVDICNNVNSGVLHHPKYNFIHTDSITAANNWNKEPISVLFVDTLHIKEQVLCELYHWFPYVIEGGLIIFHDTNWPADKYDFYKNKFWDRPEEAVKSFFNISDLNVKNDLFHVEHYPDSWGMTFVEVHKKAVYNEQIDWNTVLKFCNES